jgi:hypothetical protein
MVMLAVTLALVLAGCGSFGGKSDEQQARDAITELINARNQRDFGKVCSLVSKEVLAKIKRPGTSCEKTLSKAVPTETSLTIRIEEVRVRGDRATVDATVSETGGAGRPQTILLVKEGGDWKFSQLGF